MTYIVIGCYGRQQLNDVIRLRASFPLELFSQLDDFRYSMLTHLTLIYSQFWWGGQNVVAPKHNESVGYRLDAMRSSAK